MVRATDLHTRPRPVSGVEKRLKPRTVLPDIIIVEVCWLSAVSKRPDKFETQKCGLFGVFSEVIVVFTF